MKSMTGYGKYIVQRGDKTLTVEMKSVNNRYLEINSRIPKVLSPLEDVAKKMVKLKLARGSVDMYFSYENKSLESGKKPIVDEALVSAYVSLAKSVAKKYGIENNFGVSEILRTPEVVSMESQDEDEEELALLVSECVAGACDKLNEMRLKEGETIKADLNKIIGNIETTLNKAVLRAPMVVTEYAEKIRTRISEMLAGVEIDEARLLNETAFFADKADINEEIQRLRSHIQQFYSALESDQPQGRGLDFLSQEIGREINTMGSKSNDKELTGYVIQMKNELEKIKEQIRNVE